MATKNQRAGAPVVSPMQGEGAPIAVTIAERDGRETTVNVEMNAAAAPQRTFVADGFSLAVRDDVYQLTFIQHKSDGVSPRAAIEIRLTSRALKSFVESLSGLEIREKPGQLAELREEPTQMVGLAANFVRAGHNPGGCCFDFYYASPFSLMLSGTSERLHLEGVVRVQSGLTFFATVVHHLLAVSEKLDVRA